MSNLPWTPWHKALRLRDAVRSGELSLAIFAADLYDVIMGKARPVHQDPVEFFSLTDPTFNLRELANEDLVCPVYRVRPGFARGRSKGWERLSW